MPYSLGDLRAELRQLIEAEIDAGRSPQRAWIAHALLCKHPLTATKDREFNMLCRNKAVNEAALEVLRTLRLEEKDPARVSGQGDLLGYEYLKKAYSVERDGELVIVPIQEMTIAERNARADEYMRMSEGCIGHADELRRYTPTANVA